MFPLLPSLESKKTSVDSVFFKQLRAVLRLGFRHWRSKEVGVLALHSTFLVARTLLSVVVARLDGRIVRDLVSADGPGFARGIGLWFLLAIPSTYTNAMVRPSKAYVLAEAGESLSCCCHACARFATFNRNSPCDCVLVLPDIYTIFTFPRRQTSVTTAWAAKEDLRELTSTCEPPGHHRPLTDLVLDTLRPT